VSGIARIGMVCCAAILFAAANAQMPGEMPMGGHEHMHVDAAGTVMNANSDTLPRDCAALGPDIGITVRGGRDYATASNGQIFGYSEHEYFAEPCSRITVTFVNDDSIRHQWMIHGLPKYIYPGGMFHLEAAGGETVSGTFIVPSDDRTYLVHCDMTQHMEQGMKAQLVVGSGSGDLWSIPGVSGDYRRDDYLPENAMTVFSLSLLAGAVTTAAAVWLLRN
jgi:plastocyanin